MNDQFKAILFFNLYIFLVAIVSVLSKEMMRPGGLAEVDPEYEGIDPLELSTFKVVINGIISFIVMTS